MKIIFERSGGFAGIRKSFTLSDDVLSKDEIQKIENLLINTHFFEHPQKSPAPEGAADYFQYKISVIMDKQTHTIETTDISKNQSLNPLIEFIEEKKILLDKKSQTLTKN